MMPGFEKLDGYLRRRYTGSDKPGFAAPGSYYSPLPDSAEVKVRAAHRFAKDVDLGPSIRLRTDEQVKLLHEIAEFYASSIAYKPNVDDERQSPSYVLMSLLNDRGAKVEYHDPYVPVIKPTREHSRWAGKKSVDWSQTNIAGFDLVLIATNHASINYQELGDWAQSIVDTRNAMAAVQVAAGKVWKA
ncbi:MAG: UDP binding domain-containing protein [Verrucomicrobiota bacterium]